MDDGLPCERCGAPTYMHCHVDELPTTCRDCDDQQQGTAATTWTQRFPNDFTAEDVAEMMEAHAQLVCRFPAMDPDTLGGMIVATFDDDKTARQIERDVARQIEQP